METINRMDVLKIIHAQLEYNMGDEEILYPLTKVLNEVLNLPATNCNSDTPQSIINFFIDEEQAKKYIKAIVKSDADNQIKFINYYSDNHDKTDSISEVIK